MLKNHFSWRYSRFLLVIRRQPGESYNAALPRAHVLRLLHLKVPPLLSHSIRHRVRRRLRSRRVWCATSAPTLIPSTTAYASIVSHTATTTTASAPTTSSTGACATCHPTKLFILVTKVHWYTLADQACGIYSRRREMRCLNIQRLVLDDRSLVSQNHAPAGTLSRTFRHYCPWRRDGASMEFLSRFLERLNAWRSE
jgi:hypothetical protein